MRYFEEDLRNCRSQKIDFPLLQEETDDDKFVEETILILSSREDKERKASACGVSAHSRVLKETLNRKKGLFLWKKRKRNFVVSVSVINTSLRGNRREATTSTTQQNDERSKSWFSVGQSSGGESSRGDENERGILLPETVEVKKSDELASSSSLVFFLWISILVCLSERERERESAPHWEDVLFKSWNGWWWTCFLFFMMSRALAFLRVTDDWMKCFSLSFLFY